jgi:hypothetical protein
MKKIIICIAAMVSGFTVADAQTVRGKVTGMDKKPVEYATVILQTPDSVYVNSTNTDSEGRFVLPSEMPAYRLIVQHLLYETYEKYCSDEYEPVIELAEKEHTLGEIVINGERPVVKLVDGKITYDMPLLLSGKVVSNAYESLLQLPGVREQNGSLALAGASGVTVIINGKVTSMPHENLMAVLKMYPTDKIQNAEIMYSAPPQYHVRGAAINLILKEESSGTGLQGQVNTAYTQKYHADYTTGVSAFFPASKLTADFNYAYNRNQSKSEMNLYSNHRYNGVVNSIEQFNRGTRISDGHHIRLGMDYKLSEDDILSLVYTSQITANVDNNESSDGTFSHSDNHKINNSPIQMHNVLADYSSRFGLKAGIEYTSYGNHTNQHFIEKMTGKENAFVADAKQAINRYRLFADQSHSLPSEWTFNYGAQYLFATDNSSQTYQSLANSDMSSLDINSKMNEYTANAYAGFKKNFGQRFSFTASLTGEYYKIGRFDEWTLFPALEMIYFVSPSRIIQLSFSSDKRYPAYWEMHGAVSYLNGYGEIHGNPLLKPYKDYSAQLNYILNNKYIITLYGSYLDKYFIQLPYQAQDRLSLIYKTVNLDYKQITGLNLIIPFKTGQTISSRITLNGFYDKVKSSCFHDISFVKDNFVFYSRLDNTVDISSKPTIKLEISGAYISKNIQGPAELTALWNLDAGLKWTFFHDMAELRLKGTDLLNRWTPDLIMKYGVQDLRMNIIPDTRAVSLSFTFKFGGYNKQHKEIDSSRFGGEK